MPTLRKYAFSVLNFEITKEKSNNFNAFLITNNTSKTIKKIANFIVDRINNNTGRVINLEASGSSWKTILINLLLVEIRAKQHIVLAMESSGIVAILMEGRTVYSALHVPLNLAEEEFPVCKISRGSGREELLKQAKIIFWDKCTMTHKIIRSHGRNITRLARKL